MSKANEPVSVLLLLLLVSGRDRPVDAARPAAVNAAIVVS